MTENELLNFIKQSVTSQNATCEKLTAAFSDLDKKIDRLESHIESEIGRHGYLPRQISELTVSVNNIKVALFGDGLKHPGFIRNHDELVNRVKVLEESVAESEKSRVFWMRAFGGAILALAVL